MSLNQPKNPAWLKSPLKRAAPSNPHGDATSWNAGGGDERHGANSNPHQRIMLHASSLSCFTLKTTIPFVLKRPFRGLSWMFNFLNQSMLKAMASQSGHWSTCSVPMLSRDRIEGSTAGQ